MSAPQKITVPPPSGQKSAARRAKAKSQHIPPSAEGDALGSSDIPSRRVGIYLLPHIVVVYDYGRWTEKYNLPSEPHLSRAASETEWGQVVHPDFPFIQHYADWDSLLEDEERAGAPHEYLEAILDLAGKQRRGEVEYE